MSGPRDTTPQQLAIGLLVAIIFAQFVVLALVFKLNSDNADQTQDIQNGIRLSQFEGCVKAGNVLRRQVRSEFVDLKKKAMIPVFDGVAKTIPEGAPARVILEDAVAYLEHRIRTIDQRIPNADCLALYPPLEGQTYPPALIHRALQQAEHYHAGGESDAGSYKSQSPQSHPAQRPSDSGGPGPDLPDAGDSGDVPSGVPSPPPTGPSGGSNPPPQTPPVAPPPEPPSPPPSPPQPSSPPSVGQGVGEAVGGAQGVIQGACTSTNTLGVQVPVVCP